MSYYVCYLQMRPRAALPWALQSYMKTFKGSVHDFLPPEFWPYWPHRLYSTDSCLNLIQTSVSLAWATFRASRIWVTWTGMQCLRRGSFQALSLTWVHLDKPVIISFGAHSPVCSIAALFYLHKCKRAQIPTLQTSIPRSPWGKLTTRSHTASRWPR